MNDIDKIKQLFTSQDINNNKVGYILAKDTLLMSDEDIIKMLINDKDGWVESSFNWDSKDDYFSYHRKIFHRSIDITVFFKQRYFKLYGPFNFSTYIDVTFDDIEEVFWKQITDDFKEIVDNVFNEQIN